MKFLPLGQGPLIQEQCLFYLPWLSHEGDYHLTVVALYAPNNDNPIFFQDITKIIRERYEHKLIVGDFNLTLDVEVDRLNTYCNNSKARDEVLNIMDEFCLNDIWRIQNYESREYSWFKRGSIFVYQKGVYVL